MATTIYLVKFSGVFLGIGLFVSWTLLALQKRGERVKYGGWLLGAATGYWLLLLSGTIGGPTAVSSVGQGFHPIQGLAEIGLWPTAMTDLAACILAIADRAGIDSGGNLWAFTDAWVGWLILVAMAGLGVWRWRTASRAKSETDSLARRWAGSPVLVAGCVVAADTVLLATLASLGAGVDVQPRLARLSGLIAMPIVFSFLCDCARRWRGILIRSCALALILILFAVPPLYGCLRLAKHLALLPPLRAQEEIGSGINPELGPTTDASAFYRELKTHLPSRKTVLYTNYPYMLFACPDQRCLIVEVYRREWLRPATYRGRTNDGIAILLPKSLEFDGTLDAVKASFKDVNSWESVRLESAPGWSLCVDKTSHRSPAGTAIYTSK